MLDYLIDETHSEIDDTQWLIDLSKARPFLLGVIGAIVEVVESSTVEQHAVHFSISENKT